MESANQDALALKQVGNSLFKQKRYPEAIEYYTRAIELDKTNSIFYSNRARCYKLIERFEQGYDDALNAIRLDEKNIKAHLLAGEILISLSQHQQDATKLQVAVEKIKRSLALCSSQGKRQYQGQLTDKINLANKKLWYLRLDKETARKKALRSYLTRIVEQDSKIPEQMKDRYTAKISDLLDRNIRTQKSKVPSDLICFLTRQLLKDPVCNEHGNTYSKEAYLLYTSKSQTDPRTKKPLVSKMYYPNLNIRKAVEDFLQKNKWAYDENLDS